ncbi:MAG: T9SS type A sorting domain-containing protein, partial [Dysgonamonadaceae bacterium]|nr:T9SS type A sorting domain-containing protein [Dysgonamonadaceae bacterium]
AFFVRPLGTLNTEVNLTFKDTHSVTRTGAMQLKSTGTTNELPDGVLKISAQNSYGNSWITLDFNAQTQENVLQLFSDSESAPQLFTIDESQQKNTIQHVPTSDRELEIPLGIRSTNTGKYELRFDNVESLGVESLSLIDRQNPDGTIFDLLDNNSYRFDHHYGNLENRFVLKVGKVATGVTRISPNSKTRIFTIDKTLHVTSGVAVSEVTVSSIQGIRILADQDINSTNFSKPLAATAGVYLVTVKLTDGSTEVGKIIVK